MEASVVGELPDGRMVRLSINPTGSGPGLIWYWWVVGQNHRGVLGESTGVGGDNQEDAYRAARERWPGIRFGHPG